MAVCAGYRKRGRRRSLIREGKGRGRGGSASHHAAEDEWQPGEARSGREGRRCSAGLPEGGRRGWGPHISEGGEGKAGRADRRPLCWLAGGPVRGRGEVGRCWVKKTGNGPKFKKKSFLNFH
jgi:hypothetical protein